MLAFSKDVTSSYTKIKAAKIETQLRKLQFFGSFVWILQMGFTKIYGTTS